MDEDRKTDGNVGGMKLDDLLDEILQKNMEAAVRLKERDDVPTAEWVPEAEVFTDLRKEEDEDLAAMIEMEVTDEVNEAYVTEEIEATDKSVKDEDPFRVIEVDVGTEEDKKLTKKDIRRILIYVFIIVVLTFLVVEFIAQRTRVSGSSMENTLSDGDNLIIDKVSYRLHDPERFDIIIFPYKYTDDTYYIKRIIGLPGETVQIDNEGGIWINGYQIEDEYEREPMLDGGIASEPVTLGADEYFVLGDNRNNSSDSRSPDVGNIRRDNIVGKAWIRVYPFDKITVLE